MTKARITNNDLFMVYLWYLALRCSALLLTEKVLDLEKRKGNFIHLE